MKLTLIAFWIRPETYKQCKFELEVPSGSFFKCKYRKNSKWI